MDMVLMEEVVFMEVVGMTITNIMVVVEEEEEEIMGIINFLLVLHMRHRCNHLNFRMYKSNNSIDWKM